MATTTTTSGGPITTLNTDGGDPAYWSYQLPVDDGETHTYGEGSVLGSLELGLPTPTKSGYILNGWIMESSPYTPINNSTTIDYNSYGPLLAEWSGVTTTTQAPSPTTTGAPTPTTTPEPTTTTEPPWISPGGRVWKNRREQTRMWSQGYF